MAGCHKTGASLGSDLFRVVVKLYPLLEALRRVNVPKGGQICLWSTRLSHRPRIVYCSRGGTEVTAECDGPMAPSRGLQSDAGWQLATQLSTARGEKEAIRVAAGDPEGARRRPVRSIGAFLARTGRCNGRKTADVISEQE